MIRWRAMSETIHLVALGLWFGSLVMTGFAAAIIFPVIKSLNPALPAYDHYTGEHWVLAGGKIASRLFLACDSIQFAAGILCAISLGTLIFVARVPALRPAITVRICSLILALGLLGYQFFFFFPKFNGNMLLYWDAAQRGDNAAAASFKAAFDSDHPRATVFLGVSTVAVLMALVFGAWSAATPERNTARGFPVALTKGSGLEEPMLLRGKR